jgi:hypothetical protein
VPGVPAIYRAMLPDGSYPKLGRGARTLGVRVPKDIAPDQNGDVQPGPHGMSVAPSLRDLPIELVPKRLRHLREGAAGPDTSKVWRRGEGAFAVAPVAPHLMLQPDRQDHGVVAPDAVMPLEQYEQALAETSSGWVIDEV